MEQKINLYKIGCFVFEHFGHLPRTTDKQPLLIPDVTSTNQKQQACHQKALAFCRVSNM